MEWDGGREREKRRRRSRKKIKIKDDVRQKQKQSGRVKRGLQMRVEHRRKTCKSFLVLFPSFFYYSFISLLFFSFFFSQSNSNCWLIFYLSLSVFLVRVAWVRAITRNPHQLTNQQVLDGLCLSLCPDAKNNNKRKQIAKEKNNLIFIIFFFDFFPILFSSSSQVRRVVALKNRRGVRDKMRTRKWNKTTTKKKGPRRRRREK